MASCDKLLFISLHILQCFILSDERQLMDALPKKLRTDLAIHVHFNTLSKVKLFQDCDKNLLYDLVLKLKPILYLPGDYVCKKVCILLSCSNNMKIQQQLEPLLICLTYKILKKKKQPESRAKIWYQ